MKNKLAYTLTAVLLAIPLTYSTHAEPSRLVLIAGDDNPGREAHQYEQGMRLFADHLADVDGLEVSVVTEGWPEDESLLEAADAVVFYSNGLGSHPALQEDRLAKLDKWVRQGTGIGMMHFAVDVAPGEAGDAFKYWIGGHYETHYSVNPYWTAHIESLPDHPVARGVEPFSYHDEWYFNMRFRDGMEGVTPILVATPSDETRDGPYVHPQGPYSHIQEDKGRDEVLMWVTEREDGGRGFGFTGGHFHKGWEEEENMRNVVLNALVWVAGVEVPAGGIAAAEDSVRALYVTGGGWHDYEGQIPIVTKAMKEAVPNIDITVSTVEGPGRENEEYNWHPAFKDENWADGYDVVVYNKCNAPGFSDDDWVERIVQPHRDGLPAVLIHGTVHNFWPDEERTGQWGEFCGIISRNHEPREPLTVTFTERDHPILDGLPEEWSYEIGELYRVHGMEDGVQSLATGVSGEGEEHMIVWTHEYGEGRVFGTTIGHANETMKTDEFQTLLRQGLQWALGRR